jgi:hypothetical protein
VFVSADTPLSSSHFISLFSVCLSLAQCDMQIQPFQAYLMRNCVCHNNYVSSLAYTLGLCDEDDDKSIEEDEPQ